MYFVRIAPESVLGSKLNWKYNQENKFNYKLSADLIVIWQFDQVDQILIRFFVELSSSFDYIPKQFEQSPTEES